MVTQAKFNQAMRLKSPQQFTRVIEDGSFASDGTLVVNALANDLGHSRLGVTIPKKAGGAPVRNYWKRLVREAFRTQQTSIPRGFDFVVRPRRGARPVAAEVAKSVAALTLKASQKRKPPRGKHHGKAAASDAAKSRSASARQTKPSSRERDR